MSALERYYRAKYRRFRSVLRWRDHLAVLLKVVEEILPDAKVYVFGSALRNELTANSDVDLLVSSERLDREQREKLAEVLEEKLEDRSVFELHLVTNEKLAWYRLHAKNLVPAEQIIRAGQNQDALSIRMVGAESEADCKTS